MKAQKELIVSVYRTDGGKRQEKAKSSMSVMQSQK